MANFYYPVTEQIKSYVGLDGEPLDGGYVYFGVANQNPETNPVQMYWDAAGTLAAAQPFRTVNGFITREGAPANVYSSGDMSATVRDSKGNLVFSTPTSTDIQLALAIAGTSTASAIPLADAGGYYTTDNVEAAFQQIGGSGFVTLARLAPAVQAMLVPTGAVYDYAGATAPTGYVFSAGKTIGDGSSGATERANADTVDLFTLLWNSYTNTELVIQDSGGTPTTRGASASNDYAAHKRLPTPDSRGRVRATMDDLGGTAANRLTTAGSGVDGATLGAAGGTETHTLTTPELPIHTHAPTDPGHTHTFTGVAHPHTFPASGFAPVQGGTGSNSYTSTATTATSSTTATGTNAPNTTGITIANAGSGTAHSVTQPTIVFNTIIKL